jgi:hypothetical protein
VVVLPGLTFPWRGLIFPPILLIGTAVALGVAYALKWDVLRWHGGMVFVFMAFLGVSAIGVPITLYCLWRARQNWKYIPVANLNFSRVVVVSSFTYMLVSTVGLAYLVFFYPG